MVLQRLGVILLLFPTGLHYLPPNAGVIDQLVLSMDLTMDFLKKNRRIFEFFEFSSSSSGQIGLEMQREVHNRKESGESSNTPRVKCRASIPTQEYKLCQLESLNTPFCPATVMDCHSS
jgi:hypothetical protein